MSLKYSGVILAGGKASRLGGKSKAFVKIGGIPIIERILEIYRQIFDEIIIVTNSPEKYIHTDAIIVSDVIEKNSSMAGIHAGLLSASNDGIFVSGCDSPFLKKNMIELVASKMKYHHDAAVPVHDDGFMETLCAVYSRKLLKAFEQNLVNGLFTVRDTLAEKKVVKIPEKETRIVDPDLVSFFNVNTPEDIEKAEALFMQMRQP